MHTSLPSRCRGYRHVAPCPDLVIFFVKHVRVSGQRAALRPSVLHMAWPFYPGNTVVLNPVPPPPWTALRWSQAHCHLRASRGSPVILRFASLLIHSQAGVFILSKECSVHWFQVMPGHTATSLPLCELCLSGPVPEVIL